MKRAGDVLSAIFDEQLIKKARGYSRFFDFWATTLKKNGIAAAADHSRIKELEQGIILVETDHPGWKQTIQTKQSKILDDFCRSFPDLGITGISLMLNRGGTVVDDYVDVHQSYRPPTDATADPPPHADNFPKELSSLEQAETPPAEKNISNTDIEGLPEALKERLQRLEKSVFARYNKETNNNGNS